MPASCVTVQIGQCGTQLGACVLDRLNAEARHEADAQYFFRQGKAGERVARAARDSVDLLERLMGPASPESPTPAIDRAAAAGQVEAARSRDECYDAAAVCSPASASVFPVVRERGPGGDRSRGGGLLEYAASAAPLRARAQANRRDARGSRRSQAAPTDRARQRQATTRPAEGRPGSGQRASARAAWRRPPLLGSCLLRAPGPRHRGVGAAHCEPQTSRAQLLTASPRRRPCGSRGGSRAGGPPC